MTDEAFADFCAEHSESRFELSPLGELIEMPLSSAWTSVRNCEIAGQLGNWSRKDKRGFVLGSSGGWRLPNTALRAAAAA